MSLPETEKWEFLEKMDNLHFSSIKYVLLISRQKNYRTSKYYLHVMKMQDFSNLATAYHRGRWTEIKEYLYWSHIENNCSFSLFLKFGVFKWKCNFILSFLIQVLVLYFKIQKSWDGAKKPDCFYSISANKRNCSSRFKYTKMH